ncbi:MAG: cation:proton antiporter [Actinobacteria bacterium]|nr:cation:proton antiporter [Actinomycetota bacterium]
MHEGARSAEELTAIVFVDIAVIIVVARLVGMVFKKIRQPPVVGEIIGGILLGPTLLGAFPGRLDERLFPVDVRPHLGTVANLGLIIFMFIVGLELDLALIRGKERMAAVISMSSIVLPFGLGVLLATGLHGTYDTVTVMEDGEVMERAVELLPFALFIGASMSITAFPVLARILTDRGMYRTQIGALTLASAAVDDVLAWSLLALVLAVVASSGAWDLPRILLESAAFIAFMFLVGRPLLARVAAWYRREGRLSPNMLAVIVAGFLLSAFVTSEIGIHAIFGAFVFGAIMPREDTHALFQEILERLENVSVLVLLPVFFVATGLNVDVSELGGRGLATLALILLVACAGKLIGATLGARSQGIPTRKALAVGTLMNTRGLTELVILNVGREVGVLHDELFTLLVVMAVFTTVITEPLLRLVYPDRLLEQDIADAQRAALGLPEAYRVMVVVDEPETTRALVDLAVDVIGDERPSELVLTRYATAPAAVELGAGLQGQLADVAEAMETLQGHAAYAESRGVRATVFSQFSDDVARDLVAQVRSLDADVLLLAEPTAEDGRDVVEGALRDAAADVVVVREASAASGPPLVLSGLGPGDAAAVEAAARLARARAWNIVLVEGEGGRRATQRAAAVEALFTSVGLTCTVSPPSPASDLESGGLRIVAVADGAAGGPAETGATTLLVRARPGFDRKEIEEVVASWERAPAGASSPAEEGEP